MTTKPQPFESGSMGNLLEILSEAEGLPILLLVRNTALDFFHMDSLEIHDMLTRFSQRPDNKSSLAFFERDCPHSAFSFFPHARIT